MPQTNGTSLSAVRSSSSAVRDLNGVHCEHAVAPGLERRPAAAAGQRLERLDRVFVAVLGVDRFAGAKIDRGAVNPHLLTSRTGEVHFDPALLAVVEGMMLECA